MSNARRPLGRLFHWFLLLVVLGPFVAPVRAAGPNTTTVVDVIYRGGWIGGARHAADLLAGIHGEGK